MSIRSAAITDTVDENRISKYADNISKHDFFLVYSNFSYKRYYNGIVKLKNLNNILILKNVNKQ